MIAEDGSCLAALALELQCSHEEQHALDQIADGDGAQIDDLPADEDQAKGLMPGHADFTWIQTF